ncbi:MAG: hypothetical protein ABSA02_27685 [Trebonia sp.]|jgi:hypothetical protein
MSFGNLNVDKLLIDGKLVDAEGGAVYENINPGDRDLAWHRRRPLTNSTLPGPHRNGDRVH